VKALTGRWQKGKDVYWYTRGKGEENTGNLDAELQTVKAHEEQLMAEVALSFHWRTLRLAAVHRSQREILPSKLMFLKNPHDMDAAMPINAQMRLSVELDDGISEHLGQVFLTATLLFVCTEACLATQLVKHHVCQCPQWPSPSLLIFCSKSLNHSFENCLIKVANSQALGLKPKTCHTHKAKLEKHEMRQLLHKNDANSEEEDDGHGKGLGFGQCASLALVDAIPQRCHSLLAICPCATRHA
jgi:hypothetical protein